MEKKQANTVCLFYVAERLKDLDKIKNEKQLRCEIRDFLDEAIYNIGVNSIIDNLDSVGNPKKKDFYLSE
tara:strand:- start:295 stop:504 length:210 start_codon:yes stop_codon:yes gene_type:complete